jgi:hypothetical protein
MGTDYLPLDPPNQVRFQEELRCKVILEKTQADQGNAMRLSGE